MATQGNRTVLSALLFVLVLSGAGLVYVYLLQPIQADLNQVRAEQRTEEKLLENITSQLQEKQDIISFSSLELQRQLPVDPLVDQFLLHLEDMLMETNNVVESIKFQANNQEVTQAGINAEDEEEALDKAEANANHANVTEQSNNNNDLAMPANINRISLEMELRTADYLNIKSLLTKIEQLERIVLIDLIEFEVPDGDSDDEQNRFEYKLGLSIFYAEDLDELLNELPEENFIKPANKRVPVSQRDRSRFNPDHNIVEPEEDVPTEVFAGSTPSHRPAVSVDYSTLPPNIDLTRPTVKEVRHSYYIVQAGAYRTAQAAKKAAANLQQKGWAAYVQEEILPYRVYIGLATDLAHGYELGKWYKDQGQEVYVRQLQVLGFPSSILGINEAEHKQLHQLLDDSYALIAYLSEYSSACITSSSDTNFPERSAELNVELESIHQRAKELSKSLSAEQATALQDLLTELNRGMQQLNLYTSKGERAALWEIQQHVLDYALKYERWMRKF